MIGQLQAGMDIGSRVRHCCCPLACVELNLVCSTPRRREHMSCAAFWHVAKETACHAVSCITLQLSVHFLLAS